MAALARPQIPSTTSRTPYAPVPNGGSIASVLGQPGITGTAVPGQESPMSTTAPAPTAFNPATGYTGGSLNVGSVGVGFNPQSFVGSDAYNFIRDQGMDAVQRSAAAKGTLLSGGTLKDLMRFGSGNAATFWDQQLNHDYRMAALNAGIAEGNAGRQLSGLSSLASLGLSAAGGQGNALMGYGNAGAGGTIGAQSALNQGIGGAANSLSQWFAQRKANQQQAGGWQGMN